MDKGLSVARALTWRYVIALTLVATLSTAAWISLRLVISEQKSTAAIVNVSGRQRMLSQRTALFSSLLLHTPGEKRADIRRQLKEAADLMWRSHLGLTRGDEGMGLPSTMSPAVRAMYFDGQDALDRQVKEYLGAVRSLLQAKDEELTPGNPQLKYIITVSPAHLVSSLDEMVSRYQLEGEQAISRLQKAETLLWAFTLLLLALEAAFIFQPFTRHIKAIIAELRNTTRSLYESREHLEEQVRQRTADLQKKSEELAESAEKFRLISSSAKEAILIIAATENIAYWNPAAESMFGYKESEALSKNLHELLAPRRYHDDTRRGFEHFRATGEGPLVGKTLEITALRRNGEEFPIELSISAIKMQDEWHALGVIRDITERKKAETQLRELNETLEQRVDEAVHKSMDHERLLIQQARLAAMGEMIGNIAHQWRQPLNALALMHANIKDDFDYGELNRESMNRFVADGQEIIQRMSSTIDDFRDFFKPQKEKKTFMVHEVVDHTLNIVNASFRNHDIDVTMKADKGIQVTGYPNELSQVLLNVLSNAKDALLDRKVTNGKVDISMGQDDDMAWVIVRDNAGGIPADILPKIFDPYFTTREKGTGIGLYMSRMIMEHMSGTIEAHNVGDGTELRLTMPIKPIMDSQPSLSNPT